MSKNIIDKTIIINIALLKKK